MADKVRYRSILFRRLITGLSTASAASVGRYLNDVV